MARETLAADHDEYDENLDIFRYIVFVTDRDRHDFDR